jgi:glyoxylase-like metal-dependent hydrolase (beta-lactamase superfamily II)
MEALLERPGPITAETVVGAHWEASRSGLINLEHERARGLVDGPEPIEIYFHVLTHPERGLHLIDTGVAGALADEVHPLRTGPVGQAFNLGALRVETPLAAWLNGRSVAGVLLTHLHLDHVLGFADLDREVPVFVGSGETAFESPFHPLTQPAVDELLEGRGALQQWVFDGEGVVDVFGDESLFALSEPGHTPGSVAFVARTPEGAVLFTGDVCHTAWGWQNDVEPGTFSHDQAGNAASLAALRGLAARHPAMKVRLGHQSLLGR